jgi:hypothetical protein
MGGIKQKKANKHKNKGNGGSGGGGSDGGAKTNASGAMKPVTIADISPEFQTIILDFLRDIDCSFPEYHDTLARYLGYSHEMKPMPDELYIELYTHCREVYPVRFFDILYKNESLFTSSTGHSTGHSAVSDASRESGAGSAGATNNATGADKAQASEGGSADRASNEFLPGVDFREIWATEDITDNTKDIIWKYLQLILFSIVNNLSDMGSFGETAKLFEAIDDSELKNKLEEVIREMGTMFGNAEAAEAAAAGANGGEGTEGTEGFDETFKKATEFMNEAFAGAGATGGAAGPTPPPNMPDASSIHEHLSGILNGKIGKLAKEIAEETAADLNLDMANETSMKGVFQQLLKNPGKLSGIIKTVGSKLDSKLKSGELKESEIMQEASELMSKMKNMPGMNNLASMLSKMGMNVPGGMGGGGGAKVNFGAMQSQLNRNMKQAQMRERLLKKVQEKQQAAAAASATSATSASASLPANGKTTAVFQSGEKPAKTPRATAGHAPTPAPCVSAAPAPCVSAAPAPCVSAAPAPNVASAASTQGLSNSQGHVKQKSD